ncbi:MAG: hypothetical protein MI741_01175, partial [Rhodospirillales bacterium]|nr:hypothetical protein [Rhodospirillales bacterium]
RKVGGSIPSPPTMQPNPFSVKTTFHIASKEQNIGTMQLSSRAETESLEPFSSNFVFNYMQ